MLPNRHTAVLITSRGSVCLNSVGRTFNSCGGVLLMCCTPKKICTHVSRSFSGVSTNHFCFLTPRVATATTSAEGVLRGIKEGRGVKDQSRKGPMLIFRFSCLRNSEGAADQHNHGSWTAGIEFFMHIVILAIQIVITPTFSSCLFHFLGPIRL
jgi:hypothetical protein